MNIGILVSGRGTNMESIIEASEKGLIKSKVSVVISNKKDALALSKAKKHGIQSIYVSPKNKSNEEYDKEIIKILDEYDVDFVVLAGYLRILSSVFINKYPMKIINVHPSLLPCFGGKGFYGEHVHRAVLESGMKFSGCTVHFVTDEVDNGPIILQKCVEILDSDTPETLAERILPKEHEALIEAISLIENDKIEIQGKRVLIK
ncbi:MAG: phosphoribosylglycinamide formyltransferase [Thermoplasmata archaeon]|jgi:phosphoribosylglycinamide formyltransferase-1